MGRERLVLLAMLLVPTASTLVTGEAEDVVEAALLGTEVEEEVAETTTLELEDTGAPPKISSCAPGLHPIPMLYPGDTPLGGSTLLPVA